MTTTAEASVEWQRERRWLGYAGLIPFLAGLLVLSFSDDAVWRDTAAETLCNYAAVIASFLGAVHWGAAADSRDGLHHARLRWGIMPALLAWTLSTLPDTAAFAGFAVLFALILVVDRYLLPVLDDHYRQLRLQLSLIVVATMLGAALTRAGGGA